MFCNKCGNKLEDDMIFCNKCGNKVNNKIEIYNTDDNYDSLIELSVQKLLNNVSDKNYKGIFLYDSNYIVTDGYQSIIFKEKPENNSIIEKYKIQINEKYKNIKLNINENYYNIPIKIDFKVLETLLRNKENTGILQPYIIKYNNTTHAINPEYLLEALKIIGTDTVYITQSELEPVLLKGDRINYIILPIKMNHTKYNNTLTNNVNLNVNRLTFSDIFILIVIVIIIFCFWKYIISPIFFPTNLQLHGRLAETYAKNYLGDDCREDELKVKAIEENNGIYIVECTTTNSDLIILYGSKFYYGYMPSASGNTYKQCAASSISAVYSRLNK